MLILASASPRRRELLRMLTKDFFTCPAAIDESVQPYQTPAGYALAMASTKAFAVSRQHLHPVLGADTVVCSGAKILGKPESPEDNFAMLQALSGKWHGVLTAISVYVRGQFLARDIVCTRVKFDTLTTQDIRDYVDSGEGLDKAGGYGIQGLAGKYIARIDGCYYNVVGLPIAAVANLLSGRI